MSPFAQTLYEIALEALITTQSVRVHITRFDPISDEAYQVAWTHVPGGRIQQAMELLRGKVRGVPP